jgi:hypothetical protein
VSGFDIPRRKHSRAVRRFRRVVWLIGQVLIVLLAIAWLVFMAVEIGALMDRIEFNT